MHGDPSWHQLHRLRLRLRDVRVLVAPRAETGGARTRLRDPTRY
jgi:hypothetical protein